MRCETHNQEATAICAYCGRGLCASCTRAASSPRIACSDACAQALARTEVAISTILKKHVQGGRAVGYLCDAVGIIFVATGIYGFRIAPQARVANFLAVVLGIALMIFGVWFHRMARKKT
jgi:sulfite exporter TauE/SafE